MVKDKGEDSDRSTVTPCSDVQVPTKNRIKTLIFSVFSVQYSHQSIFTTFS